MYMLAVVKSLIVKLNSVAVNLSGLKVSRFYVLKRDSNVEPLKIKTKVNFNVRFINSTDIQELSEKCNIDFKQYLDRGNGGIEFHL